MKQIKDYLANQKDIATMMMLQELQKEQTNLVMVKYWTDRVVVVDSLIQELKQTK